LPSRRAHVVIFHIGDEEITKARRVPASVKATGGQTSADSRAEISIRGTYDTAGRRLTSKDALGNTTSYSEIVTNNQRIVTTTYPDGGTRIVEYYRDGQLAKVTGTAAHPMRYEYGVVQDEGVWRRYTKDIKLDNSGNDTAEVVTNFFDMMGRNYKTVHGDGATRQSFYNSKGQLSKTVDPDGVTTLYSHNARGELEYTALDMNRDGVTDFAGTDRIQRTAKSVETLNGLSKAITRTYVWATNNSAVSNVTSISEISVDSLRSWRINHGLTNEIRTVYAGNGNRYVTNTAPDGSYTISHFLHGQLQSATRKDASGAQLGKTTYGYDAHGRQKTMTDARNGTTTHAHDNADRVISVTTPAPGTGASPQTTSYTHDYAGRVTRTGLPDGNGVTNVYSARGELLTNYGARVYPVAYGYDAQGRKTNMITWTNFAGRLGAATTWWKFNSRGFMTNKVYADGNGPKYTYSPAGRLLTRLWARGITTTYHTNAAGEVFATTYSDGMTPSVTNYFDRLGRKTNIIDGGGSRFLRYADSGLLTSETNAVGVLAGISLDYGYDAISRRSTIAMKSNGVAQFTHTYTYDTASRLTNVSDGTYSATYSHVANSPLVSQITFRSNTVTRMTTAKKHDLLDRLLEISSQPIAPGEPPSSFVYEYDDANQRVRVTDTNGFYWLYGYDRLGQLINTKRYWGDGTLVAGQQYEYSYDDIGSRSQTKEGGDKMGGSLRTANYVANNLNQYTQREVPGAADIIGIAKPDAAVTVNGSAAHRQSEYYRQELSINNASAAVWQSVTNQAVLGGVTNTEIGNLLVAKTPQSFWFDSDGNQTSDGVWTNSWDGENRGTAIESTTSVPAAGRGKEMWTLDTSGRWIQRVVYTWSAGSYVATETNRFVWDRKVLLAILDDMNRVVMSFQRGADLAGSLQGAGGVGGLLAVNNITNGTHFVGFDGNGNAASLVGGTDGTLAAKYEYEPFGKELRVTGAAARANPLRFSTQWKDGTTCRTKYLYRDYQFSLGRWMSRDLIGERGGPSLQSFVKNRPPYAVDALGLDLIPLPTAHVPISELNAAYGVDAFTGDVFTGEIALPFVVPPTIHVVRDIDCCCAQVERAQRVDVIYGTILPTDAAAPGNPYTVFGATDQLPKHEDRRREVYVNAYATFIAPIQSAGDFVTRCGTICRNTPGTARSLLLDYLAENQDLGIASYTEWVKEQQRAIGGENKRWELDDAGLRDFIRDPHQVPYPWFTGVPCPSIFGP
jgi:RHS repeat-associated protein